MAMMTMIAMMAMMAIIAMLPVKSIMAMLAVKAMLGFFLLKQLGPQPLPPLGRGGHMLDRKCYGVAGKVRVVGVVVATCAPPCRGGGVAAALAV